MGETRKCKTCGEVKELTKFIAPSMLAKRKQIGDNLTCGACRNERHRLNKKKKSYIILEDRYDHCEPDKKVVINGVSVVLRQCAKCEEFKSLKDKYNTGSRICRKCIYKTAKAKPGNKEKYRAQQKKYRESEHGKKAQRAFEEKYKKNGKREEQGERRYKKIFSSGPNSETYRKYVISSIKYRAKQNNVHFDISWEDLVMPDVCPVLGIKINIGNGREYPGNPSVDRLDNNKGYTKENIRIISLRANLLKKDASFDDIEGLYNWMKKELGKE